ncbi:hypothetical protein QFZ49_002740 [Streptomyces turgidiscabies]|uniref:Uncharacterized protein n=1 Tax=Streptomyces turgidiscabies TaxID=85558 RepID=A0ABU0RLI0_9ACTN|nr:hypothetical protein [Streptomyces turgidiscabies]
MDSDALPAEGQKGGLPIRVHHAGEQGVQGGVEQCGVKQIAAGLGAGAFGQDDFGEDLAVAAPGALEALEGGPVGVSELCETVVGAVQ